MKTSTMVALAAFGVLLAAVLLTREDHVNVGVPKITVPALDSNTITGVEVSGAAQALLTSEAGAWFVAAPAAPGKKFAADDVQLKGALTQLAELRAGDFITENPVKHPELEVDDAKGLKIKVLGSGPAYDIILGKAAKTGGAYFRLAGSNAVFTTTSNAAYAFRKNVTAWRKKAITTAAVADVSRITTTTLTRDGFALVAGENNTWALENAPAKGFRFDTAAAARVAQTVTSLSAQDFDDSTEPIDPHGTIVLERKNGAPVTVTFGAKRPDNNVPLQIEGDPQRYIVSGYMVEHLPMRLEQLRELTLFAFAPDKVTKVTLLDKAGKKTVVTKDGTTWKMLEPLVAPPQFDPQQVGALLTRLQNMRAARAEPGLAPAKAGLAKAPATIELLVDGHPQSLRFGTEVEDKRVYAQGSADDLVYVIGALEKQSLEAGVTLFNKPPPPPTMGGGQMQGLDSLPPDIRAKIEAQLRQQQPH